MQICTPDRAESAPLPPVNLTSYESKYRDYQADKMLFDNVLVCYRECSDLPAVTAGIMDREVTTSRKWSPDSCHFIVDVDKAIARTLHKEPLLRRAWTRMVHGIAVPQKTEWALVQRMAVVFRERGLHPRDYFRRTRR